MTTTRPPVPPKAAWWLFWIPLFAMIPVMFVYLRPPGSATEGSSAGIIGWIFVLPGILAVLLRMIVLPRQKRSQTRWVSFVTGIALCEGVLFFAIFIGPQAVDGIGLALSMILMALYCPLFLKIEPNDSPPHGSTVP